MTIDKRRPSPRPAPRAAPLLPAFTPVPRQCRRHDGWTEERQRRFIEALADTGSVKAAAHRVNMTPEGAYLLRRHPDAASFRAAWEAALALGIQQLEDIAMERALHGTEVPVYSYGKLIGSRVVHNDRLLMFLLRNRAPTRFAADGRVLSRRSALSDPAEANRLSRLKAQWRKEWEAERAAEAEAAAARAAAHRGEDELVRQIETMHRRWFTALPPAARRAYRAFREAEAQGPAARDDEDALADLDCAEAEYAEWFTPDRRPRVWQAIDLVFAMALHGGEEDNEDEAPAAAEDEA